MTDSKIKGKAYSIVNNLRRKLRDLEQRIIFCQEHKFDFEARALEMNRKMLSDIITEISVNLEIPYSNI